MKITNKAVLKYLKDNNITRVLTDELYFKFNERIVYSDYFDELCVKLGDKIRMEFIPKGTFIIINNNRNKIDKLVALNIIKCFYNKLITSNEISKNIRNQSFLYKVKHLAKELNDKNTLKKYTVYIRSEYSNYSYICLKATDNYDEAQQILKIEKLKFENRLKNYTTDSTEFRFNVHNDDYGYEIYSGYIRVRDN